MLWRMNFTVPPKHQRSPYWRAYETPTAMSRLLAMKRSSALSSSRSPGSHLPLPCPLPGVSGSLSVP